MMSILYKVVDNDRDTAGADAVKRRVFAEEQNIAEDLVFSRDDGPDQLVVAALDGEDVIGTARVVFPAADTAKIERMAVLREYRDRGIGKGIMAFLEKELKSRGAKRMELHAQHTAVNFYKGCGFRETGPEFTEAGIRHIKMERAL